MLYIPTRNDIENLSIGDKAMDCFGKMNEVVKVEHKGTDINGKLFACYMTYFSHATSISMSMKEDELVRHVGTSKHFNSHQLDLIEAEMLAKNERIREL